MRMDFLVRTTYIPANCSGRGLLDIAAQADALEGVRQGIEDVKNGRARPALEALEMFRRIHAIPR
jgi:hypothetical protein